MSTCLPASFAVSTAYSHYLDSLPGHAADLLWERKRLEHGEVSAKPSFAAEERLPCTDVLHSGPSPSDQRIRTSNPLIGSAVSWLRTCWLATFCFLFRTALGRSNLFWDHPLRCFGTNALAGCTILRAAVFTAASPVLQDLLRPSSDMRILTLDHSLHVALISGHY